MKDHTQSNRFFEFLRACLLPVAQTPIAAVQTLPPGTVTGKTSMPGSVPVAGMPGTPTSSVAANAGFPGPGGNIVHQLPPYRLDRYVHLMT